MGYSYRRGYKHFLVLTLSLIHGRAGAFHAAGFDFHTCVVFLHPNTTPNVPFADPLPPYVEPSCGRHCRRVLRDRAIQGACAVLYA